MSDLWSQALEKFDALAQLNPIALEAALIELQASDPELHRLVEQLRHSPNISLQPVPFSEALLIQRLHAGSRLGAYRIIREIGRGGMGTVWLGERDDGIYQGQVAIKILSPSLLPATASHKRFAREGEILAKLTHPNIAHLLDAGVTEEDVRYLVLEYVEGIPITRYCETHELGIERVLRLFCQALDAVAHAQSLLILHRDIKPSNVLVTQDGTVKLLDFGLGKLLDDEYLATESDLTRVGGLAYTPRYAPPEQMRGDAMSTASDVYSLGVTLYEVLTGATLDPKKNYTRPSERLADSQTRSTWSKRVRGDIDAIVAKAVSESPKDRYVNASVMKDDLLRFLNHEPVTAQHDSGLYRTGKFIRRHRLAVGSTLLTLVVVLASLAVSITQTMEANRQREFAVEEIELRNKTLEFVMQLLSQYAPQNVPISTVQLLDIGLAKIPEVFKDDYLSSCLMARLLATRFHEMGERERGVRAITNARDYALKSRDPALIVDTTLVLADTFATSGNIRQARETMREAMNLFSSIPKSHVHRQDTEETMLAVQTGIGVKSGDAEIALSAAKQFIVHQQAGQYGQQQQEVMWNRLAAANGVAMRFSDGILANEKTIAVLKQQGAQDGLRAFLNYGNRMTTLLAAGDPAAAVKFIEIEVKPLLRQPIAQLPVPLFSAVIRSYALHGQTAAADDLLRQRISANDTSGSSLSRIAQARFDICAVASDAICAQKYAEQAANVFVSLVPDNPAQLVGRRWVYAVNYRLNGNDSAALETIATGLSELAAHTLSPSPFYAQLLIERAKIELKRGDAQGARATAVDGLAYIKAHYQYDLSRCVVRAELLKLEAIALGQLGSPEQAQLLRDESDAIFRTTLHPEHPSYPRKAS
jgi:eukaryotic-like serine/threonine-protein kinase